MFDKAWAVLDGLRYYLAKSTTMPIFVWTEWRATEVVMREIRATNGRPIAK